MSNRPVIRLLLIGILLLTGVHVLLFFQGVGNDLLPRTTLLDRESLGAVRLTVTRKGEPATVLEKGPTEWRIVKPYAARAEEMPVNRILDELALTGVWSVHTEQELLKFDRTRANYGLEDPAVTVTAEANGTSRTVGFGILAPTGDAVYASVDGDSSVYVIGTNVFAAANLSSEGFRSRALCPHGTASVDAFELKRGTGAVMRFRQRGGQWQKLAAKEGATPEPASALRIRRLLTDLEAARAVSFVWPVGATNEPALATVPLLAGYGLDSESAVTLTLHGVAEGDQQVSIGSVATDGRVYALVQNAGAIVTVDGALCDFIRTADFTDTRLFPFEAGKISRISVTDNGVNYLLAKGADGAWLLDAPVAAAADPESVELLLTRLLELTAANRSATGLTVSLQTNALPETVSADALLEGFVLSDLRSREIIRVEPGAVSRLTVVKGEAKPEAVAYDKDLRSWKVESSERNGIVSEKAVARLLSVLNPLKAEKIVKLKVTSDDLHRYGLDAPQQTIAVDQVKAGTLRRNILIGKKARGGVYATLGASDAIFILSDDSVSALTAPLVTE